MKTKSLIRVAFIFLVLRTDILSAQILVDTTIVSLIDSKHNYYVIKNTLNLTTADFIANTHGYLRTATNNQLSYLKTNTDSAGSTHAKYLQTYNGVPIENSQLIFHSNGNGRLVSFNGVLENNVGNINTTNLITQQAAINVALLTYSDKHFFWMDSLREKSLKENLNDSTASYYPKPKLVIAKIDDAIFNNPSNYFIAYVFSITNEEGTKKFYIDANNSQIVKSGFHLRNCFADVVPMPQNNFVPEKLGLENSSSNSNSLCDADCVQGSALLLNGYGWQYIYTQHYYQYPAASCRYRLKDRCSNTEVYVKDGTDMGSQYTLDFNDFSNNWNSANPQQGPSAFFCATAANDFWRNYFGRHSFDDNNHQVPVLVHSSFIAQWDPNALAMKIGQAEGNWLTAIDIIGHEFAHAITDNECLFPSSLFGETGAVSEGLSDIFGTLAEFWVENNVTNVGRPANYDFGEDVVSQCGHKRSLIHPEWYCEPTTYQAGPNWKDPNDHSPANDFGGVHWNAGVIGKWFYLLAEGGSGTNDKNNHYCVHGIGKDDAAWVVYQTIKNYGTSNMNFNDLAFFTEVFADSYWGISPHEASVFEAWYAVGVENSPIPSLTYIIISGTENGTKNYNYNLPINIGPYQTNPGSNLDISSATEIDFGRIYTPTGDVVFNAGTELHAYIAPGCVGAH